MSAARESLRRAGAGFDTAPHDDLAALLADPACVADVPAEAIASVLTEVSAQEARLGTVKAILAARLASAAPPPTNAPPEPATTADGEAAARTAPRSGP